MILMPTNLLIAAMLTAAALMLGCGAANSKPRGDEFVLRSDDFEPGQPIPKKHAYTGEGENVSPQLSWANPPEGTKQFALVVDDPDAPSEEPWVHWVAYGIPTERTNLPQGASGSGNFREGTNSFGESGYGGPKPPPGDPHRYFFKLYALDEKLDLNPGMKKSELLDAIEGHILAETTLTGTYQRSE